jgi:S-adenosylmethionine-diacylgycerolhomoserine-N-methlytransferase
MAAFTSIGAKGNTMTAQEISHKRLMDATYRHQRLIYDATRRYFLLGRDHLIRDLAAKDGSFVLEIACGTGRNLKRVAQHYPKARLFGLDISDEMLRTARQKLGPQAHLVQADACDFDGQHLFGVRQFDRIILSYSLSMIPDWTTALTNAAQHLAPGGQLHVVDFGTQEVLPSWFRQGLNLWLGKFHVTPRPDLQAALTRASVNVGGTAHHQSLMNSYAQYGVIRT